MNGTTGHHINAKNEIEILLSFSCGFKKYLILKTKVCNFFKTVTGITFCDALRANFSKKKKLENYAKDLPSMELN